jgi:Clp amino terminal domain, pathogenicity island component
MFERYTEKARRVIFFARYEASQFGSPVIETEHLLLGLLRESKGILKLLPRADTESIRNEIEGATKTHEKVSTSVDLPLSHENKLVLKYADEEAKQLNHRHIGTEHLLLGLLRVKDCFAARMLAGRGADLETLRKKIEEAAVPFDSLPLPSRPRDTIELHGIRRDAESIRQAVMRCREYSWHWQKREWTPRDIVVNRKNGAISFDLRLAVEAPSTFELVPAGWKKKDPCAVCHWELFESNDDAEHGTGYTNGREWLCTECYEKFWERPDFIAGSYSDIT